MGCTLSTYKALKETQGMTTSIPELEKRIRRFKPVRRSIIASHIWFNLCDLHQPEEMAGIKSLINYNTTPKGAEAAHDALLSFGFSADYAEAATQSQVTLANLTGR